MVVDRGHQEDAFLGFLVVGDLDDVADRLGHEHAPDDGQCQLGLGRQPDEADGAAQRQRADVAHEHLSRVGVEPQEAYAGAAHRPAEHGQLARPGHVRHPQVLGDVEVAQRRPGRVRQEHERERTDDHRSGGQTVQAVGQVDGVRFRHQHEHRKGDVGR
jgi:hypothetical protein